MPPQMATTGLMWAATPWVSPGLCRETYLQRLTAEWYNGPCRGMTLPRGAVDWASVTDPLLGEGETFRQAAVAQSTSGAGRILVGLAVVVVVGLIILQPEIGIPVLGFGALAAAAYDASTFARGFLPKFSGWVY